MELYIQLAGSALPGLQEAEETAKETEGAGEAGAEGGLSASRKIRKKRELAAMLRTFPLRVLDSTNPQSPLSRLDKQVLSALPNQLLNALADPLDAREGSWLHLAKISAERLPGFRLPSEQHQTTQMQNTPADRRTLTTAVRYTYAYIISLKSTHNLRAYCCFPASGIAKYFLIYCTFLYNVSIVVEYFYIDLYI